jgi:simple sugar transport system permease protein
VVTIIQGTIVLTVVVANEIARRIARRQAERLGAQVVAVMPGDGGSGGGTAAPGLGSSDQPEGVRA